MLRLAVLVAVATCAECIYLNASEDRLDSDDPAVWTETGVWGPLIEEWVLGFDHKTNREERVMKLPPTQDGYVMTKYERPPGKITNNINGGSPRPHDKPPTRPVSETDLYLLSAMEKLVYRADFMEKRLRRVEEMLYYVMAGSRMDQEPCPENFTRAGSHCYFFADLAGREKDWKAAKFNCMKMGAILAEMETIEENQDVIAHIQANSNLRAKEFWTGGLNPGLLWIWSNSARPVSDKKGLSSIKIMGDGRCLRLAYDPALRNYNYRGSDCSARYQYICELQDKSSSNSLTRIARERNIEL